MSDIHKTIGGDSEDWPRLAKQLGCRLPHRDIPLTTLVIKQWLKKCNFTLAWYKEWSGYNTVKAFVDNNPSYSTRAFAGLMLEEWYHAQWLLEQGYPEFKYTPQLGYKQMPKKGSK